MVGAEAENKPLSLWDFYEICSVDPSTPQLSSAENMIQIGQEVSEIWPVKIRSQCLFNQASLFSKTRHAGNSFVLHKRSTPPYCTMYPMSGWWAGRVGGGGNCRLHACMQDMYGALVPQPLFGRSMGARGKCKTDLYWRQAPHSKQG